ncbi:PaaI family thioesterase [Prolixibacteraceae bacterium JC049]|nr:PaaI family thioesterase [Prolixibacteraceae bacterium JC049]
MRKIVNAYAKMHKAEDGYRCFGCSPYNEDGLHLEFVEDGDIVYSEWNPQKRYEGFMNVLHGGIQATLLDEIANWIICVKCNTSGVTTDLNVKYKRPVLIDGGAIRIVAELKETTRKLITVQTHIEQNGQVCCEAEVRYRVFSEEMAKAKYMYPGADAFFTE